MKKVFLMFALGAFVAGSMTSCKKDYTCTCSGPDADDQDVVYELNDVKKNDAEDACDAAGSVWILAGYTCEIE